MKIAVTYQNGEVFQHFGHCEEFKLYLVEDNQIKSSTVVSSIGSGHGALAGFLQGAKVDALICGGIGGGARVALAEVGIKLYPGVKGSADFAVKSLLANSLDFNPDTVCNHHGEDHSHGEGHQCGEDKHGCGSHK